MKKIINVYLVLLFLLFSVSNIFTQELNIKINKNTIKPNEKLKIMATFTNTTEKKIIITEYLNSYENARFYSLNGDRIIHGINREIYFASPKEILLESGESYTYNITYIYKLVDKKIRLHFTDLVYLELKDNFHVKFKVKYFPDMGWIVKYVADEVLGKESNEYIFRDSVFSNEVEIQFLKDS